YFAGSPLMRKDSSNNNIRVCPGTAGAEKSALPAQLAFEDLKMDTCDRLHSAALELTGSGPIKQRLIGAYVHHLDDLTEEQMPNELREDFCALKRALRAVRPLPGEDAVRATVRKMSDGEASRYAGQIVNLFSAAARVQNKRTGQVVQL